MNTFTISTQIWILRISDWKSNITYFRCPLKWSQLYGTTRVMGRMTLKWFHIVEQVLSVSTCHSFSHSRKIPTIYTKSYFNSHSIMRNSLTSSMFIENGTKFIWTIFFNYHSRIYWYQVHFRNEVQKLIKFPYVLIFV